MEAFSVDYSRKAKYPSLNDAILTRVEAEVSVFIIENFDSLFAGKYIFLNKERVTSTW